MKIERKEREKNVSGKNFFFCSAVQYNIFNACLACCKKERKPQKKTKLAPILFFLYFFSGFVLGLDLSLHTFMLCANLLEWN